MSETILRCIDKLLDAAAPVLKVAALSGKDWYRKPKGARHGPWLQSKFEVLDEKLWKRREPCIYFVKDGAGVFRYVGISLNRMKDRWRTSPSYDQDGTKLSTDELFHSQCWPHMTKHARDGGLLTYAVSVLHGAGLLKALTALDHEISVLAKLAKDPEIVVTAMELWICKYGHATLWNATLTGGKNPRALRVVDG